MAKTPQDLIEALRSDEFTHGRHRLQSGAGNCCLGVAAALIDPENTHGWKSEAMPAAYWDWFWAEWPWIRPKMQYLATQNDSSHDGFTPVIEYLEKRGDWLVLASGRVER